MGSRAVWLAGLVAVSAAWAHAVAGGSSAGKAVEADWLREVIRGRKVGTAAPVDDALGRGRALVAAMRRLGARQAVAAAESELAELTRRRDTLRKLGGGGLPDRPAGDHHPERRPRQCRGQRTVVL